MSSPRNTGRRTLSDHRRQQQYDNNLDDSASLLLTHTKSHEISVAESIAVQGGFHDGTRSDLGNDDSGGADVAAADWPYRVRYLLMLCSFLTSMSFGVTQVPLLYVFRLMTCDAYYESHPSPTETYVPQSWSGATDSFISYAFGPFLHGSIKAISEDSPDRCSHHTIESSTALSISLLGASTTVFGILNLFLTSALIKRIGVKRTLLIQVFFPAVRLVVQNIGVEVWGNNGIIIVQCSQIVSVLGGPSGYMLVLNTFITEVVEYEGRTAALGRLAGSMMFGSAIGFLLGGVVADAFGIKAPFRLTLVLFLVSFAYVAVFLPYVPPAQARINDAGLIDSKKARKGVTRFLGPLAVFVPQRFILTDGTIQMNPGALLLAIGVFLAILATGYLPTLLQLYATNEFHFGTTQNGGLIFMYSMLRGVFLTFAFPQIIAVGRKFNSKREADQRRQQEESEAASVSERQPLLTPTQPQTNSTDHGTDHSKEHGKQQTFTFDLTYARFSLVADGLLTLLCSFVREGWQMYLVAAVLPLSAGTGSASKGVVLQMIGSSAGSDERTDALAGISLVENMARLSTSFFFGVLFAAFTSIGRADLVFTCNAAAAIIGYVVLLFAHFPPEGSRRLSKEDDLAFST